MLARGPSARAATPYLVVTGAVLLANALYLLGIAHLDPWIMRSGLAVTDRGFLGFGDYTIDPNDGYTAQALGVQALHQWLAGSIPWWNPYEGLGGPLAGEMQSAVFFPLLWLQALPSGFLVYHVVLELIAGLSTVAFLRAFGLSRTASATGGVLYGLSGSLVWLMNAAGMPNAFFPLMLLGVEQAASGKRWTRPVITLAVAAWLSLTSGFPEGTYLQGLFVVAFAAWRMYTVAGARKDMTIRILAGGSLGLALAAPALVAFLGYLADGAAIGGHAGAFSHGRLEPPAIGMIITPYALGPIFGFPGTEILWSGVGGYLTAGLFALAVMGLFNPRYRGLRILCAVAAALVVTKTYASPGLTGWFNLFPGMKLVAFYRYGQPVLTMAGTILAALGVDLIQRRHRVVRASVVAFAASVILVKLSRAAAWPVIGRIWHHGHRPEVLRWFYISSIAAVAVAACICALALLARRRPNLAAPLVLAVVAIEAAALFAVPSFSAPRHYEQPNRPLVSFLHEVSADSARGADLGRFYTLATISLQPNYGAYYSVPLLNFNDVPAPRLWTSFVHHKVPYDDPMLFGVRGFQPDTEVLGFSVYLKQFREASVEYVLLPSDYRPRGQLASALERHRRAGVTTVYRLKGSKPYAAAPGCTVDARSRTRFELTCSRPSTLVRRELFDRNWGASVDGKDVVVRPHDTYFQGVKVPAGRHSVSFAFVPRFGTAAVGVSLAALLALLALLLVRPSASDADAVGRRSRAREGAGVRD